MQDRAVMLVFGVVFTAVGGVLALRPRQVSAAMEQAIASSRWVRRQGSTSPLALRFAGSLFFLVGLGLLVASLVSALR